MNRQYQIIYRITSLIVMSTLIPSFFLTPIVSAVSQEKAVIEKEKHFTSNDLLTYNETENLVQGDTTEETESETSQVIEVEKEITPPIIKDSSIVEKEVDTSSKNNNLKENLEENIQVSNFIDRSLYPEFSASADNTNTVIYSEPGIAIYINSVQTAMRIELNSNEIGSGKYFWHGLIPSAYKDSTSINGETLKKSFEKITFNGSISDGQYVQNRLFINAKIVQGDLDYIPNYLVSVRVPSDISDKPNNAPKFFLKEVNFPEARGIGIGAFQNVYSSLTKINLPKLEAYERGNFVSDIRFSDLALTDTPLDLPSLTTMPSNGNGFIMTSFNSILTPKLESIPKNFVTKNTTIIDISGAKSLDPYSFSENSSLSYNRFDTLWFNNNPDDIQFPPNIFHYYNMTGAPLDISILTKSTNYTTFGETETTKPNDSLNVAMENKNNGSSSNSKSYSIQRYSVQQSPTTIFNSFPEKLNVISKVATSGTVSDKNSHKINGKWYLDGQIISSEEILETQLLPTGVHQLEGVFEIVSNKTGAKGFLSTGIINYDLPVKKTRVWGDVPYEFEENTGVLTFTEGGTAFSSYKESPWNRTDEFKVDKEKIKKIVITSSVKTPVDSSRLFSDDEDSLLNLEDIEGLTNLDTSETTNMKYMFYSLGKLKSLDVSSFDTSKVTDMSHLFQFSIIESLDLAKWDTQNVTLMTGMLSNMELLSELKLGVYTKLKPDSGLQNAPLNIYYTGKWSNISYEWFGNASELLARSQNGVADTYIWQNTKPVNPTNPEEPVDPTDPINPNSGDLAIAYASNLSFGRQSKTKSLWNATADVWKVPYGSGVTEEGVPMVSIRDLRDSDKKGWSLTVKQDSVFEDSKGNTLKGAEIIFKNMFFAKKAGAPNAVSTDVVLNNFAQEIASSDATTKKGKWSLGLGQLSGPKGAQKTDGVLLSVPTTSAKNIDKYTTSLTYELTADPTK